MKNPRKFMCIILLCPIILFNSCNSNNSNVDSKSTSNTQTTNAKANNELNPLEYIVDFHIGMHLDEALKVIENKYNLIDHEVEKLTYPECISYDDTVLFFFISDDTMLYLYFDSKTSDLYSMYTNEVETAQGLKMSDSIDKMKELYGEDYITYNETYTNTGYEIYTNTYYEYKLKDNYLKFVANNNEVTFWKVSMFGKYDNTRYEYNNTFQLNIHNFCIDLEKPLSSDFLKVLNKSELSLLRNSYYARHGYIFKTQQLTDIFSKYYWYEPLKENVDNLLSEQDHKNVALILEYEKNKLPKGTVNRPLGYY